MATIAGITVSKTKQELKDVFGGLKSCLFSAGGVKVSGTAITMPTDCVEFPTTVESLSISQDDPTINHYKVIGMTVDWFSTSESGDLSVSLTVPSKAKEILSVFYGSTAVKDVTATGWSGSSLTMESHKVKGSLILVNDEENQLMIINGIELYAKPMFENSSTEPFAFGLSGTITVDENSSDTFMWLKKANAGG